MVELLLFFLYTDIIVGLKEQVQFSAKIHLSGPASLKSPYLYSNEVFMSTHSVVVGHSRAALRDLGNLRDFGFHSNHLPEGTVVSIHQCCNMI